MSDAAEGCCPVETSDLEEKLETDIVLGDIVHQLIPQWRIECAAGIAEALGMSKDRESHPAVCRLDTRKSLADMADLRRHAGGYKYRSAACDVVLDLKPRSGILCNTLLANVCQETNKR